MLTQQLRELEADGLVTRVAFNEIPPKVSGLTEHAKELGPIFGQLCSNLNKVGPTSEHLPASRSGLCSIPR